MTDERKSRIFFSALIAIGVPLLVFIAVPFEIWYNNIEELNYYFSDVFGFLFVMFLVSAIAIFSALFFVPEMVYKVLRGLAIGGGLMIFLQASYLNVGVNGLAGDDGIPVIAKVGMPMAIVNALVWVVVITGCTVASILVKKVEITKMVSVVLALIICVTQVMNILVGVISTDFDKASPIAMAERKKEEDPNYQFSFLTNENLTTVAEDRNVVVFVIDRFDAVRYADPNMDLIKGYVDDFGGFTYFNDNISKYARTYPSIAYMLTNKGLALSEGREDYFNRAYNDNVTLEKLDSLGYSVNIYTDDYYGYADAYNFPDYIENVQSVSDESVYRIMNAKSVLLKRQLVFSAYRCFPTIIKDFLPKVSSSQMHVHGKLTSSELTSAYASTNLERTRQEITKQNFTKSGDKAFSLIHVEGCHVLEMQASTSQVQKVLTDNFDMIKEYVDEMKRLGVYDNSTIIITGDHACSINDTTPLDGVRATALFVKPANQTGTAMQTSSAQVSHENLWATIFKSEGITFDETEFGKSVFDVDSTQNQTRKYIWYKVNKNKGTYSQMEYTVYGNGRDFANWTLIDSVESTQGLYD